jgi:hypothetical protein
MEYSTLNDSDMSSADNDYSKLEELSESDFEIVDGQPDIQGWDVRDSDNNKIGEVDELLFNPQSRKVRYVILHMENNDLDLEDGRVLVPMVLPNCTRMRITLLYPILPKPRSWLYRYTKGEG